MIKKFKSLVVSFVAVLSIAAPATAVLATAPASAAANIQDALCSSANSVSLEPNGTTSCSSLDSGNGGTGGINSILTQIVNIFSAIVGVIAVLFIILGGFRYITSGGDSSKVGSAKNTIIYALVGLIIVAFAQVIVRFVLAKAVSAQ